MTERQPVSAYTPSATVRRAVESSQVLLTYAAHHKVAPESELIKILLDAKNALEENTWSPVLEADFWRAYTILSQAVKPATIQSLKDSFPNPNSRRAWWRIIPRARLMVHVYRGITVLVLIVLVVTQIYWLIGAGLVSKIDALNTEKQDIVQQLANQEQAAEPSVENPITPPRIKTTQQKERIELIDKELEMNYNGLLGWSQIWQQFLAGDETFEGKNVILNQQLVQEKIYRLQRRVETDTRLHASLSDPAQRADLAARIAQNDQEKTRLQQRLDAEKLEYTRIITKTPSEFALEVLQNYLLPLLYGLLGAAIYALRSLTTEIENLTYEIGDDIEYGLRMALGALGGLGIGWFLAPKDLAGFQSVSPLALSFIVGYNIDMLFSLMDRFIEGFSKVHVSTSAEHKAESPGS